MQANALLTNAASRGLAGLCEGNEAAVQQALGLDKSKQTQAYAVLTAGICGNSKLVLPLAQELSQEVSRRHAYPECVRARGQGLYGPRGRVSREKRSMTPRRRSHIARFIREPMCRGLPICSCTMPITP